MTLLEMKKKILGLIEEVNPDSADLTDDPDIATKLNNVINQVMYELARFKKIPDYVEMEVAAGDLIRFEDIETASGYEVYQLDIVRGAEHEYKAQGTIIKVLESGMMEIEYFRYPERITETTKNTYELELSPDALEIMPYGVAADLLKSDVSNNYGQIYAQRFEELKSRLDSRYSTGSLTFEGGVTI